MRSEYSLRGIAVILAASVATFASCSGPRIVHDPAADIISAVQYAHGLEQYIWSHRDEFRDREAVFRHYRTGFSEELAVNLTSYTWPEGHREMRPGDITLLPPETVYVVEVSEDYARAYFPTPDTMKELWGQEDFTVIDLQKEGDRWVVVSSSTVRSVPSSNL